MKSTVRKWLMGETTFREYAKISMEGKPEQKVWLKMADRTLEISTNHWLLCIEPMIFGIWLEPPMTNTDTCYHKLILYFGGIQDSTRNKIRNAECEVAVTLFGEITEAPGRLLLLKLEETRIHHLQLLKRYLIFRRYYKKDGLTYRRFRSYVSAYSYPRRIRIASFRDDGYYNIFPMDLLGDVHQAGRYVLGLRHTNIALHKIIQTGKLVVSEVSAKYQQAIYELGKHHSSAPPAVDRLNFQVCTTRHFGFYIPAWVESYKEIRVLETMNLGSHMLLWGEQVGEHELTAHSDHLFLVHFLHYLQKKNTGYNYVLV